MRLTGAFVLVLGIFMFAGSALAGNGHGNGNGNGGDGSPGNSAGAPGQVKQDSPPAPAVDPTTATTTTTTTTTTTVAAPTEGVKPSNTTAHDTHAPASSDRTKKYGNGQTAGAIAIHHGASPSTVLHGPGNSQPHKAAPCSGGHEIDVHALKGRRMSSCGDTPDPTPTPTPNPTPDPGPNPGPPTPTVVPTTKGHKVTTHPVDPAGPRSGESAGKTASHRTGASAGVLAATRQAELPFTGLRLWIVAALGLLLVGAGSALRQIRTVGAPVQSGHGHTDRSRRRARGARSTVGGRSGR
jgi:hypothetical protein